MWLKSHSNAFFPTMATLPLHPALPAKKIFATRMFNEVRFPRDFWYTAGFTVLSSDVFATVKDYRECTCFLCINICQTIKKLFEHQANRQCSKIV